MRKWSRPTWPGSTGQRPNWLRAAGIVLCLVLGGALYFSTGSILLAVLVGLGGLLLGVVSHPIIDRVPHRAVGRVGQACRRRREGNFRPEAESPADSPGPGAKPAEQPEEQSEEQPAEQPEEEISRRK